MADAQTSSVKRVCTKITRLSRRIQIFCIEKHTHNIPLTILQYRYTSHPPPSKSPVHRIPAPPPLPAFPLSKTLTSNKKSRLSYHAINSFIASNITIHSPHVTPTPGLKSSCSLFAPGYCNGRVRGIGSWAFSMAAATLAYSRRC